VLVWKKKKGKKVKSVRQKGGNVVSSSTPQIELRGPEELATAFHKRGHGVLFHEEKEARRLKGLRRRKISEKKSDGGGEKEERCHPVETGVWE